MPKRRAVASDLLAPEDILDDGPDSIINVPVSLALRQVVRRSVVKEYPVVLNVPLAVTYERTDDASLERRLVPTTDEVLYTAIRETTGKIGVAYSSQKCALCLALGFRVCNRHYDGVCVFCQACGTPCESPPPAKRRNRAKLKDTDFPKRWLYDCNRRLVCYLPDATMEPNSTLHTKCVMIPPDYCLESGQLDAVHRAASHHVQLHEEWYAEDHFNRFDPSALLAMGYLAEEIIKDLLRGHLFPTEGDLLPRRQRTPRIPEFRGQQVEAFCRDNPELRARIQRWRSKGPQQEEQSQAGPHDPSPE